MQAAHSRPTSPVHRLLLQWSSAGKAGKRHLALGNTLQTPTFYPPPQTSSEVLTTVWLPEQFHLEPNLLPASLHPRNYSPSPAAPPRSPQTQSRRRLSKITTLRNRLQPHSPSDLGMSTRKRGLENKTSSNATQGENTEIGVAGVTRVQLVFHKTWHVVENCSLLTSGKWQWFSWTPCTLQEVRVSTTVGWHLKRWLYHFYLQSKLEKKGREACKSSTCEAHSTERTGKR